MSVIFVFRARVQSVRFSSVLTAYGFRCSLVSTPHALSLGCGMSVSTAEDATAVAQSIIRKLSLNTFIGVFRVLSVSPPSYERIYL